MTSRTAVPEKYIIVTAYPSCPIA